MSRDWSKTRLGPTREQALLSQKIRDAKDQVLKVGKNMTVTDNDGAEIAVIVIDFSEKYPLVTVHLTETGRARLPRPWNT